MAKAKDTQKQGQEKKQEYKLTVYNYKKYMAENGYDYLLVKYNTEILEDALANKRFATFDDIKGGKYDLNEYYLISIK